MSKPSASQTDFFEMIALENKPLRRKVCTKTGRLLKCGAQKAVRFEISPVLLDVRRACLQT